MLLVLLEYSARVHHVISCYGRAEASAPLKTWLSRGFRLGQSGEGLPCQHGTRQRVTLRATWSWRRTAVRFHHPYFSRAFAVIFLLVDSFAWASLRVAGGLNGRAGCFQQVVAKDQSGAKAGPPYGNRPHRLGRPWRPAKRGERAVARKETRPEENILRGPLLVGHMEYH